ncbi:hypothetical protein [Streptomyces alkaliterrae]|uniref:Uncharacterized protein n=1 Tax=Streptomyces alkaliterrae TaxID=2213162 RepID=A0A5P0YMR3_9ACTN|nr:hypothetical protein [Streptomyces alkaliterrae]MBB1258314.1 hypothetical protein [Streptomyces alkaliterrae]MQS00702.1 hypothetical protein [Streptomyces alkaliterrae]
MAALHGDAAAPAAGLALASSVSDEALEAVGLHPLVLSEWMRGVLRSGVHALLACPELRGAADSVRAAAVVAAAKTNAATGEAVMTTGELARWIGVQRTTVCHCVRPRLQQGVVASVDVVGRPAPGRELGPTKTVRWWVEAWRRARSQGGPGDPLWAWRQRELATLLRLCEALFAPGWQDKDGSGTPPGLLAWETGHGAATLRLALLLLVLDARPDGSVRLCGGAVDARGRVAATVGRLLGRDSAVGAQVAERLEAAGLVVVGYDARGRERLVIPAVAAAHTAVAEARKSRQKTARAAGRAQVRARRATEKAPQRGTPNAWGDQIRRLCASPQVSPYKPRDLQVGASASLHATHSPGETGSEEGSVDLCFSGVAAEVAGERCRERAHTREDQPPAAPGEQPASAAVPDGPLRGEQPTTLPSPRTSPENGVSAWRKARIRRLPAEAAGVLGGLAWPLWHRIDRAGAQKLILKAVTRELAKISGRIGPDLAEQVLLRRVEARLAADGGPEAVTQPIGWFLKRGLPQRGSCIETRCDDGTLMDTGQPCPSCQLHLTGKRALRRAIRDDVAAQMPDATEEEQRAEVEARLRAHTAAAHQEAEAQRRHAAAEAARRREAIEEQRAQQQAQPCRACCRPNSAGLCDPCREQQATEQLLAETVELVVAAHADLEDPTSRATLADATTRQLRDEFARVQAEAERAGLPDTVHLTVRLHAELTLADHRTAALNTLARTPEADAEAHAAAQACLRRHHPHTDPDAAQHAAEDAGDRARQRAAHTLLEQKLTRLRALTTTPPPTAEEAASAGYHQARAAYRAAAARLQQAPADSRPRTQQRRSRPARSRGAWRQSLVRERRVPELTAA